MSQNNFKPLEKGGNNKGIKTGDKTTKDFAKPSHEGVQNNYNSGRDLTHSGVPYENRKK